VDAEGGGNLADVVPAGTLLAEARAAGVARLDAELLLSALLRIPRSQLIAFDEREVDPLTAAMFRVGVERRSAGEPLAYITGVKEFWSLPLTVAPGVLVPRPETELLVELCLALPDTPGRVADLGTGSGAIAVALASERPQWQVIATDFSMVALDIAAINCRRLRVANVELRQGRWCEALDGQFDAIVSNPPYIAPGEAALTALAHEPQSALVAADGGFADLLEIAAGARARLRPGGQLLLEHGATQAATLAERMAAQGYIGIHCHRDLAGHDRVTAATWPGPAAARTVWP
jgi:release factor glutamine methyltransferase